MPLLLTFFVGLTVGGYLFARSLPRSFLALNSCGDQCLRPNDLLGLLASAGIQRTPNWLPFVVAESKTPAACRGRSGGERPGVRPSVREAPKAAAVRTLGGRPPGRRRYTPLPIALMTRCLRVPTMIEIEYIVKDSKGVERLRTSDKKEADAYDRTLENAERLAEMLRADQVVPSLPDAELEELTIYLARRARDVERILKGKPPEREEPAAEASVPAKQSKAQALRVAG